MELDTDLFPALTTNPSGGKQIEELAVVKDDATNDDAIAAAEIDDYINTPLPELGRNHELEPNPNDFSTSPSTPP